MRCAAASRWPRCCRLVRLARESSRVRALASEEGISLIEVLVSVVIVGLTAAAIGGTLIASTLTSSDQRKRSQAAEIAQQDQARLDGMTAAELSGLNQTRTATADGTTFTVTSTAQYYNSSGSSSCGSSGAGAAAYYKIDSSVTWPGNHRPPVAIRSLLTPAAGGTMIVQVYDQTGLNGLAGATVTATGADYASGATQSGGCVVFGNLTSGSYNVSIADTGYVDQNGNSSPPSLTSTVTATGVSTTSTSPVYMGLAANVNANFYTPTTSPGSQQADAISWYGAGSSLNMAATKNSTLSPSGTLGTVVPASGSIALFPFYFSTSPNYANNYRIWAGKCQQMEAPNGFDQFTINPGASGAVNVEEPELDVLVRNSSNVRVKPTDVKLSFASTSGTSCTDSWYPAISSSAASAPTGVFANPGQPFASTATSGSNESASGQQGAYTVCADLLSGASYYKTTTATGAVQNNNFTTPSSVTITLPSSTNSSTKC